jgi:hypothetical protein
MIEWLPFKGDHLLPYMRSWLEKNIADITVHVRLFDQRIAESFSHGW